MIKFADKSAPQGPQPAPPTGQPATSVPGQDDASAPAINADAPPPAKEELKK